MSLSRSEPPARLYLKEWLKVRGKKQAALTAELGWEPGRVSKIISGKQTYTGSDLSVIARWLMILPHELLMLPEEAESLKRLREVAARIVEIDAT